MDKSEEAKIVEIKEPRDDEYKEVAWALPKVGEKFAPIWINRGKVRDEDVRFEILYNGICHSDCHIGNNDTHSTIYPCVPGHEILGRVTEVGKNVKKFKIGDNIGVGCFVGACMECKQCKDGEEQYCDKGMVLTYNGERNYNQVGGAQDLPTFGGYSASHVVHQHFVVRIPDALPLEKAAPILCAGITLYDPLKHWGATSGKKMTIGVVGIGGLGTMGIKLSKALGHNVVAISSSDKKEALAKEKGATHFCVSTNKESMEANAGLCDLILNTVSAEHDINLYMPLLAKSGVMVQLGVAFIPHQVSQLPLMFKR